MKIMVFGFDGLRPDCISAATMPRLNSFLQQNVQCVDHRAVYPTETYVNHPSIFTGFLPEQHGIIANAFFDPGVSRKDFFLGSSIASIEYFEKNTVGRLFRVPSITETLARKQRSCITLSSNSAGSTRLIGHKSATVGGINIAVNSAEFALPEKYRQKFAQYNTNGSISLPDNVGSFRIRDIFRSLCSKQDMPDLSILWFGEPDHSFHRFGIHDPKSLDALKTADSCFGELYDEYAAENDNVQVITVSDHGHITVREHFDLKKALVEAGFRFGENLEDQSADFILLWGYSGNIYLPKPHLLPAICQVLMDLPETGMLFTKDRNGIDGVIPGTFSRKLVAGEFETRSGDIRFILRHDRDQSCVCSAPIPVGAGIHGGLSTAELSCLLGFGGSVFRKQTRVESVTGAIDITPTMYAMLGISPEIIPQGRIIQEVFNAQSLPKSSILIEQKENRNHEISQKSFFCGKNSFEQRIEIDYRGQIPYIKQGGRL